MTDLNHLLENNRRWAEEITQQDADYFSRHLPQQTPKVLWIGCSDSRVPVSRIIDAHPGEVFVHRNIANVVAHKDVSCMAVLHYALEVLRVQHIVVCGHTGCGGVAAAMEDTPHGEIDNWLRPIKEVHQAHTDEMARTPEAQRWELMCALNVCAQLRNVAQSEVVQRIWKAGTPLTLHGWIYNMETGLIRQLETVQKP